jgi:hypothetical protein
VKVTVAKDARVRVLPQNELDKGNVKVKAVKPDPDDPDRKLGGVAGTLDDVEKGMWVAVALRRNRSGSLHLADVVIVLGKEETRKRPSRQSGSGK